MAAPVIEKKRFFCREWAFIKLSHYLEQRPTSKTCGVLVIGGSGSGKTALSAELAWPSAGANARHQRFLNKRLLARHFCQARSEASLSPAQFVRSLVAQLLQPGSDEIHRVSSSSPIPGSATTTSNATTVPLTSREMVAEAYAEKLRTDPEIQAALQPDVLDRDPDDALKKALLFPLLELEPPKCCLFLLVDSIDERQTLDFPQTGTRDSRRENDNVSRTIAELLGNHHHLFPQWLLLVCTARRQSRPLSRMFSGFRKIPLDDLRKPLVMRDIQQYILARLDQEEAIRQHITPDTADMLNQLHIKSNGCFLYIEKVLDGVAENFIVLREVREIPCTLNGLYLWLCQRLFSRKQFVKVQPLLNVILAAKLPITQEILYKCVKTACTNITIEDFNRRLHLLRRVISVSRAGALMLFHHSFAEWLLDVKHCTQKYLCSAVEGHAMLAAYYTLRGPELNADEICVLGQHLQRSITNVATTNCNLDVHTLQVLWMIGSGAPIEDCYLDSSECILWPRQEVKLLKLLIDAGAKPSEKVVEDDTSKDAVSSSQVSQDVSPMDESPSEPLTELLGESGDINQADSCGQTVLHTLAADGNASLLELALTTCPQAKLEATDRHGQTPLNLAARHGYADVVRVLLASGACADHADCDGWTALRAAAWGGHTEVVTILLERGAAVDHQDKDGMTPLLVAAFEGHKDVCELLLEYEADVDHCDATGRTPLWAAASMGHGSVVSLLLFWGCYVDSIDNEGRTVLSVAAAQGGTDVVKQLLNRGLDEQHRDNSGWTPLHYAAFEGHIDVCEALLEAGAKIDETDNDGKGALMLAAQEGHAALLERLLEQHRAPIDQHAHDGKTALRLAALEGHYDTVRVLLSHNADVNAKDADGRSTLYILALENRLAMARFLLEHARADVESRDSEGRTPLHVSAWQGHVEMVALLLTEGSASVNACDNEKRTPLHSAAWQGHAAIVRLLLEHGATPDHTCNQGATALGIAAQEGHEHCVRALLNHGADPSHSDHCGRNAIKVAAKSGHDTVVRLLEEHSANQRSLRPGINGGESSSATSVTSNSTAETKPSSAILNPLSTQYSPAESPDSTKRRSCVSLGNNSSNSKSSSNLTGSTKSDQGKFNQNSVVNQVIKTPLSFTQQLQQCSRGAKSRPLSKLLSPLKSEPQSPIYASPPHSPLSDSLIPYSPTNTSPPSAQTAANVIQSQLGVSLLTGNQNIPYKAQIGGYNHTSAIYEPINIKTEIIDKNDISKPFELTNEMLGLSVTKDKKNGLDEKRNSADTHFTRDTHMRIILGNSGAGVGRSVKHTSDHTPASASNAKPKRNGLVSNPAMRLVAGVRNGIENATNRNKPITTRVNGFQWKAEARKETPL
ncbi:ankyrin repeat domain-containing protein 50 isoform X3 [Bombus vosnesenskii]|uniref:Ankyrin repeat domain-containing protein 50 isoform X3 n=3 Tax=Pyrobombus TaxID=144703 RepID=A0A6J3LGJ3_9HYME|nr:ankyrin repeat domain-containing protein 50 isoform X5 [Bombus impatiens]XP_033190697.1 ankyrin repeat domain-containing protein 50 isoform X3 [Bombus vancouverensis nearcticus]XP_033308870.1 ankyrin repeat domain-containing protein 50 isoform X3 [Bombus bifarius]XP_033363806.1 ankyrin repeat domain-containing protein 50 isoform X3 [Bombus vosnesenskii]